MKKSILHTPVCDMFGIEYPIFLAGMGGGAALLRSMNDTALASSGLCGARGGLLRRLSLTLVRTAGCGFSGSVRVAASVNESRGDDDSLAKLSLT